MPGNSLTNRFGEPFAGHLGWIAGRIGKWAAGRSRAIRPKRTGWGRALRYLLTPGSGRVLVMDAVPTLGVDGGSATHGDVPLIGVTVPLP